VNRFVSDVSGFLDFWIPKLETSNRQYLTVSIGCTGGYHRSV
jgi:RNase adapter protein RapZ